MGFSEMTDPNFDRNYERLMEMIQTEFAADPDRAEKLTQLYTEYKDRLREAPASTKRHYHNAFPGGYLAHILNVIDTLLLLINVFRKRGGVTDFTRSEAIFAAMHHDLGKLGDEEGPNYLPETSSWHRDRGSRFKHNTDRQTMTQIDRAVYILQSRGIRFTKKEFLGMKLADGLYAEGNEAYFKGRDPYGMKTALPYLVHWADHMSTIVEQQGARIEDEGK